MSVDDIIKKYSVRIVCNGESGSGIIYVDNEKTNAYVFTVAHIFPPLDSITDLYIEFHMNDNLERITYISNGNSNLENRFRIKKLNGYNHNGLNIKDDGAIIEISKKEWMYETKYSFETHVESGTHMKGTGYPKGREAGGDIFECSTVYEHKEASEQDFYVKYREEDYSWMLATDTSFLDGYSGTGLYLVDGDDSNIKFVAVLSRDATEAARLYLTSSKKLQILMEEMASGTLMCGRYPWANYVLPENVMNGMAERSRERLDIILKRVFQNSNDHFRCLCGYAGVGKSYTVNLVKKYCDSLVYETSWTKLVDCLNGENLEDIRDRVFILDPMEELLTKRERAQLIEQNEDKTETAMRSLNTKEKLELFIRIENVADNLKRNNIHILLICHRYFWKDVELKLKEEELPAYSDYLKNINIVCEGYDIDDIRDILKANNIENCAEFFFNIPLIRRPQWLNCILSEIEGISVPIDEEQYYYEYYLYNSTLNWVNQIKDSNGRKKSISMMKEEKIEEQIHSYIKNYTSLRGHLTLKWSPEILNLISNYSFTENRDGFVIEDSILLAYLISDFLYKLAKRNNKEDFLPEFMNVYNLSASRSELDIRIRKFLLFFLREDRETESNVLEWLREEDLEEYYNWLYTDTRLLIVKSEGGENKKILYNYIKDVIFETESTQKYKYEDVNEINKGNK